MYVSWIRRGFVDNVLFSMSGELLLSELSVNETLPSQGRGLLSRGLDFCAGFLGELPRWDRKCGRLLHFLVHSLGCPDLRMRFAILFLPY